jgi:hypothetical protein
MIHAARRGETTLGAFEAIARRALHEVSRRKSA